MYAVFEEAAMSANEYDALIVKHLRDLELAVKRLDFDITVRVYKAMESIAESWSRKNRWAGEFDWKNERIGLWLAPPQWKGPDAREGERLAYFELDGGFGDDFEWEQELDYFMLTRLCGLGEGKICLRWNYGEAIGANKSKWVKFVQPYVEQIRRAGFEYETESGLFFIPIHIEADSLASAIKVDAIEEALKPFSAALDLLLKAKPEFDSMLAKAKKHFAV
jgi:hypothetical protein